MQPVNAPPGRDAESDTGESRETESSALKPRRQRWRRGSRSGRKLTWSRRLTYALAIPFGMSLIRLFWHTCRIRRVAGAQHLEDRLFKNEPSIICYWHRHQLFSWRYLYLLLKRGCRIGWLISASVDGEVPTGIAQRMGGGAVFRGSTTTRGTEALRGMYKAIVKDKLSPASTPDGPKGPRSQFKPGMAKLAQLTGAPLVPMSWAAKSAWILNSWDRFVVPKPFTRIVIAIGEPVFVPRDADDDGIEAICRTMEAEMEKLFQDARRQVLE